MCHDSDNLCMRCRACCAAFRVSFFATEVLNDNVPVNYTVFVNELQYAMRGTEQMRKRCCALNGQIGHRTICTIYSSRPTACRNFNASRAEGEMSLPGASPGVSIYHFRFFRGKPRGNKPESRLSENCDRARAFYGLVPFGDM